MLSGTEPVLADKIEKAIKDKMNKKGIKCLDNDLLKAISEAIAETIIPHFVQNSTVNPGQAVATTTGAGSTTTPGSIS